MHCPGFKAGTCGCQTTLRRDLAEKKILAAVASQLLNDPQLRSKTLAATEAAE